MMLEIAEVIERLEDNKEQVIRFIIKKYGVKKYKKAENLYKQAKDELEKNPNFIKDTVKNFANAYEKLAEKDLEMLKDIKNHQSPKYDTWDVPTQKTNESKDELDPDKLGFKNFKG